MNPSCARVCTSYYAYPENNDYQFHENYCHFDQVGLSMWEYEGQELYRFAINVQDRSNSSCYRRGFQLPFNRKGDKSIFLPFSSNKATYLFSMLAGS